MKEQKKTKEQLVKELAELRQRVAELEESETGLQRAEEELQEEKNKLQAIVDAMEYGLTIQDREYNITYQNQLLQDIFGRLGEKCYRVYEGREQICDGCPVEMAWADGQSHTSERKVVMPSGETAFWENTANPIRNARGEMVACLEIARNITERRRVDEALAQRVEELERFHRLAVGRELRMIELKRQVNELSEELGKKPPYDLSILE